MTDAELWVLTKALRENLAQWLLKAALEPYHHTTDPMVNKETGDYNASGTVVGLIPLPFTGKLRVVVAHPQRVGSMLHIYSATNLEPKP